MINVYISKSDELRSFISQKSHMCVKRYSKICMLFILLNNSGRLHWDETLPSTNVLQVDKYFFPQYTIYLFHNTTFS